MKSSSWIKKSYKYILFASLLIVMSVVGTYGVYRFDLEQMQKSESINQIVEGNTEIEKTETVAVDNKINTTLYSGVISVAGGTPDAEDFTILEIIPHEYCSVFPYLIGGMESQTAIGTKGLMKAAGMSSSVALFQSETELNSDNLRAFTLVKGQSKTTTLNTYIPAEGSSYADLVTTASDSASSAGKWYIETNGTYKTGDSGYFEYVGTGGLYQITNYSDTDIVKTYVPKAGGSFGLQNINSFTTKYNETDSGPTIRTDYDFNLYFVYNDTIKFNLIMNNKVYSFANSDASSNKYDIAWSTANNSSGLYYKNESGNFVYAKDRTKAPKGTTAYYDVKFKQSNTGSYYIGDITPAAQKGNGEYCVRSYNTVYVSLGTGKGCYEPYIESIAASAIGTSTSNLAAQKWIWVSTNGTIADNSPYTNYSNPTIGARIYVKSAKIPQANYARNGYVNNEWFKLFCMNWENYTYDYSKTSVANVNIAKLTGVIDEYNIHVIQRTPNQVTVSDIADADLIYISNNEGFEGIKQNWQTLTGSSEILPTGFGGQDLSSFSLVETIYKEYYARNKAVMMAFDTSSTVNHNSNLYKLFLMFRTFEDPDVFAFFYDDLERPVSDFQIGSTDLFGNFVKVNDDGSLVVGVNGSSSIIKNSNIYNPIIKGQSTETLISSNADWNEKYFYPWMIYQSGTSYSNSSSFFPYFIPRYNAYDVDTYLGRPYMTVGNYAVALFNRQAKMKEIYMMLQNTSVPVISFQNAEQTAGNSYVQYVDEFQDKFWVDFRVTSKRYNIQKIEVQYENVGTNYEGVSGIIPVSGWTTAYSKIYSPNLKNYEINHLTVGNSEFLYSKTGVAGYRRLSDSFDFFPNALKTQMQRRVKVLVTYPTKNSAGDFIPVTVSEEMTIKVRDLFDLT